MEAIRVVAAYCGANVPVGGDAKQPTATVSGSSLTGAATICKAIASASPHAAQLLGATPEAQAQVAEWLTWVNTELTPLVDDKLIKVNEHLASRTYLVGNSLTAADLAVFGVVHVAVAGFPVAQTMHFCNLIRWYDFLQHTLPAAAAAAVPSKVSVLKPKFAAPAAPAASAAPAAAKAESKPASAAPAGKPATAAAAPAAAAPVAAGKKDAAAAVAAKLADGKAAKPAAAAGEQAAAKGGEKEGTRDKAAGSEGKKGADAAAAKKEGGGGGGSKEDDEVRVDMLDLRVGRIVKIDKHPNADSLYLEEIDLGEDKPRQVISGLVKYVPVEAMRDRLVVVACNLKPAKMRDVMSYGMVMCASSDDHEKVDPIAVPPGAKPGDKVNAQGYDNAPLQEINPKKKILERLFPDMKTDANCVPGYKGAPFVTAAGPATATIPNAWVR